jgi:hypothetical protein
MQFVSTNINNDDVHSKSPANNLVVVMVVPGGGVLSLAGTQIDLRFVDRWLSISGHTVAMANTCSNGGGMG